MTIKNDTPCTDPENGSAYVYDYLDEDLPDNPILTLEQRHAFEMHLERCPYCVQILENPSAVHDLLKIAGSGVRWNEDMTKSVDVLPVTSITSPIGQELIYAYDNQPLSGELAASGSENEDWDLFPLTVSYADGQIVGRFETQGSQLFFTVIYREFDPDRFHCELVRKTAAVQQPSCVLTLQESVHLGCVSEFVQGDSRADILQGLQRHFDLRLRRKA